MLRKRNKTVIYGLYNDETDLLTAVNKANSKHLDIFDVYSPFPIHGLDHYHLPLVFVVLYMGSWEPLLHLVE